MLRLVPYLVAVAAFVSLAVRPDLAPWLVLAVHVPAVRAVLGAWRGARGTALRGAVAWSWVALGLGAAAQLIALSEPLGRGRPVAGHLIYLWAFVVLAALMSVLNARTPGEGAWAILMALLVVVFLIPWLEGPGLMGGAGPLSRLRLDNPWNVFYGLLVVAGVTNYLPTRYGPAAALVGAALGVEYVALTRVDLSAGTRALAWSLGPCLVATAATVAGDLGRTPALAGDRFDDLWFWFRDHWGVVWGLRVQERFNRTAEAQGWKARLTWQGLTRAGDPDPIAVAAAEATLTGLLRRFARPDRLGGAAGGETCGPPVVG